MIKKQPKPVGLLIAIQPPKEICDNIVKLRNLIVKSIGQNIYGNHDPHITLFVNTFLNFSEPEKVVKQIIKNQKPFLVKLEGVCDFSEDPVNKTHTIVYKIKNTPELKRFHKKITSKLNSIRTDYQQKVYLERKLYSSQEQKRNILKYGFPFGPDKWIFHASIGSVPGDKFNEVWKKIQKYNLTKRWKVDSVGIFVHLGSDGFVHFKEYQF